MKRQELSASQIEDVMRLRDRSASWLGIEKQTGIPRRIAQRTYFESLQKRTAEKLSAVRKELAKEDFQEHRKLLLDMAMQLVSLTTIPGPGEPSSFLFETDAQVRLSQIWQKDRWVDSLFDGILLIPPSGPSQQQKRQVERRNRLLFNSLRVHTKGRKCWRALDDWRSAWEGCRDELERLKNEIRDSIEVILSGTGSRQGNLREGKTKLGVDEISSELFLMIKQSLLGSSARPVPGTALGGQGDYTTSKRRTPNTINIMEGALPVEFSELPREVRRGISRVIKERHSSDTAGQLRKNIAKVRKAALEIEESLDPVELSPLILATRCELCPA